MRQEQISYLQQSTCTHENEGLGSNAASPEWMEKLLQVSAFRAKHKRFPRSGAFVQPEKSLGQWIVQQKLAYKENRLLPARRQLLIAKGIILDKDDVKWHLTFKNLLEWKEKNERYPREFTYEQPERSLAWWLKNQRRAVINGRLSADRRTALIQAGIAITPKEDGWHRRFEAAKAWRIENGRDPGMSRKDATEKSLGAWLRAQWRLIKKGILDPDKKEMLAKAGFALSPTSRKNIK